MTMADTVPTLPAALTQGRKIAWAKSHPRYTTGSRTTFSGSGVVICNFPLFQYEAGSYPLSGMATVSIHREQVMISGAQPTANHRRQLLEGLSVSSQNPQSNPTHLLSETINSKLQLTIDERRHPLMSRGLPALVFGWLLSRY